MAQAALQCKECGKSFRLFASLKAHERIHMKVPEPYVTICDEVVGQVISDERIHGRKERDFKCKHCGKCFRHKVLLSLHNRIHTREEGFQCKQCGKCFSQEGNLNAHCRIHMGQMPYKCYECGRSFQFRGNLFRHGRNVHGFKVVDVLRGLRSEHNKVLKQEKPFSCQECLKYFSNALGLKIHTGRVHSNKQTQHGKTKPFKCNECGKHFIHNRGLELHNGKAHKVSSVFVPESLNKSEKQTMQNWFQTKTRTCLCKTCGKWFHPKGIKAHASKAHGEKQTGSSNELGIPGAEIINRQKRKCSCVCSKCGKRFRNKCGLRLHSWHAHKDHEDFSQQGPANVQNSYQQCITQTRRHDNFDQCFHNERVQNHVSIEYKEQELEHDNSSGNLSVNNYIQHAEDSLQFDTFVSGVFCGEASNILTHCMSDVHIGKEPGHFSQSENPTPEGIHCESQNTSEDKECNIELMPVGDESVQIHTMVKHTEEEPERFVQNQEGNISVTNDVNQTSDVSLFLYECDKCSKRFDRKRGLNTHIRWKHKGKRLKRLKKPAKVLTQEFHVPFDFRRNSYFYNCGECDKSFQSEKGLQIHSIKMHREKNPTSLAKSSSQQSRPREVKNPHECENGDDQSFINEIRLDIHEDEMRTVKEIDEVNLTAPDCPNEEATVSECYRWSSCNERNACKCDKCGKVFSAERRLKIHIGKTHALQDINNSVQSENLSPNIGSPEDKNSYRCNKCTRAFSAEKGLKIHLGKVHSQSDAASSSNPSAHVAYSFCNHGVAFECSKCSKVLSAKQGLKIHMAKKHSEFNKESSCNVEDLAQVNSSFKLGKLFKCKKCGKDFSHEQEMKEHIRKAHTNQDRKNSHQLDHISTPVGSSSEWDACKCNNCGKGFSGIQGLKIHIGKIHAGQNRKNADQSGNLSQADGCSDEEKSHKCDKCSRIFSCEQGLKIHVAKKHLEYNQESFCNVGNLAQVNGISELGKAFKCRTCGKGFSGEQGLKIHRGKIHADQNKKNSEQSGNLSSTIGCSDEEKSLKCEKCSRIFSGEKGLNIHMAKKHSEYKQEISCNVENLAQVNGISELGKPVKCLKCGKDFRSEQGLKIHYGKAHINQEKENSCQLEHIPAPVGSSSKEENVCDCGYCGKICSGVQGLKIHIAKVHTDEHKKNSVQSGNLSPPIGCSYEESSYKCDKCSRSFSGEQGLKIHIGRVHADQDMGISHQLLKYPSPPIGCSEEKNSHEFDKCGKLFSGNLSQANGCSDEKSHKCDKCSRIFSCEQGLKMHMAKKHSEYNQESFCNVGDLAQVNGISELGKPFKCSKDFSGEQGLKKHFRKAHTNHNIENSDQKEYLSAPVSSSRNEGNICECKKCGKVFSGEQGLKIHIGKIHSNEDKTNSYQPGNLSPPIGCSEKESSHMCKKCSRYFGTEQGLNMHMAKMHSETSHSGSSNNFGNISLLDDNVGQGEAVDCCKCGRIFYSERGLKIHMSKAHGPKYSESYDTSGHALFECNKCSKVFGDERGLNIHTGMIHLRKDTEDCDMSELLSGSNRIEEGVEHKCEECSKTFGHEKEFIAHRSRVHLHLYKNHHSSEKGYQCPYCGMCFIYGSRFQKHILVHFENPSRRNLSNCRKGKADNGSTQDICASPTKKNKTDKYKTLCCWICGDEFDNSSLLHKHYDNHLQNISDQVPCTN